MTDEPIWINKKALQLLHEESLATHGGASGMRDEGLLDSALARPENLFAYGQTNDVAALAASYAFGLAKNHAFVDGNKRVAFLSIGLFLALNGHKLAADQVDAINTILALASGELEEEQLATWIRENMEAI